MKLFTRIAFLVVVSFTVASNWSLIPHKLHPHEVGAYDPGLNPDDKMQKELIDILADIPDVSQLASDIMGRQKIRKAFGATPLRMLYGENETKILFIGQDATHIAEAAGRPATAGYGGRAQDMARHFGVEYSAAFMNTYPYTISGQYGAYDTPYMYEGRDGQLSVGFGGVVDSYLWMLTQDNRSPLPAWRNRTIDWIFRQNKESLKLVVLFGGSARDSVGGFIESIGGRVGTRKDEDYVSGLQIPELKLKYGGGNNKFPVPLTKEGKDAYAEILGYKPDYSKASEQKKAIAAFKESYGDIYDDLAIPESGPYGNGMVHPGQFGGYDLNKIEVDGVITRNLKGLELSDGTVLGNVLVVQFKHPTFLSRTKMEKGQEVVNELMNKDIALLEPYRNDGWSIEPDDDQENPGQKIENRFASNKGYNYGRGDIPTVFYDFGTPGTRMVPVSTASRSQANMVIWGTRDRAKFSKDDIEKATSAQPNEMPSSSELFINRPRSKKRRYDFDPGPGKKFAQIMKGEIRKAWDEIYKKKPGMNWKENGIDMYNVKSHPDHGDFGHYRGSFDRPQVIILADPHGNDDLITARALTGERGQYIHGMMEDLRVDDNYLVIKTVPFSMEGATEEEWTKTLEATTGYRDKIFEALLTDNVPDLFIADGKYAADELRAILYEYEGEFDKVFMKRYGDSAQAGVAGAALKASKIMDISLIPWWKPLKKWRSKGLYISRKANIPDSQLSFYSRVWAGTSGDRVLEATDKYKGFAYAVVAPEWAYGAKAKKLPWVKKSLKKVLDAYKACGIRLPTESIKKYYQKRRHNTCDVQEFKEAI